MPNTSIKTIKIQNFTRFENADLTFCEGINVVIGQNGTGKTHLLKLLFALLKAEGTVNDEITQTKDKKEEHIAKRLIGCFRPNELGRLVKRQQGQQKCEIKMETAWGFTHFSFATRAKTSVKLEDNHGVLPKDFTAIYLPPREMLSTFQGFTALYEKREVAFDETYYFLAKSLSVDTLKGARLEEISDLVAILEKALKGKVVKEDDGFYIKFSAENGGKLEAALAAEGLRKIGTILHLIMNGEFTNNSILFWDEPEANLNPALIAIVAEFLMELARKGVQVFIATHDYLLTQRLSMYSEHRDYYKKHKKETVPPIKFFGLCDAETGFTIEEGTTLMDIPNNPILNEFANFYDTEQFIAQNVAFSK